MRKRKRSLRSPALYRVVARMLFRGWTCTKIGRKLGRSGRAIRYLITCPEFDAVYRTYEAHQLAAFDRIFPRLLLGALDVLARLLRHREASVRQRAVELIVAHTQILEKLAARSLDHPGLSRPTSSSGERTDIAMTDEQREAARTLMRSIRSAQPQRDFPAGVIARVTGLNGPNQN